MENAYSHGCIFCRSGKEEEVARVFSMSFPEGKAIVPTRSRIRRYADYSVEDRVPLLPGYVFFKLPSRFSFSVLQDAEIDEDTAQPVFSFRPLYRVNGFLKVLRYSDGSWALHGSDDQFARLLFQSGGHLGVSKAYFDEGNRIRILDGFLKDYEGSIIRVNKKTRTVEVMIEFRGKKVDMWLGYELVEILPSPRPLPRGGGVLCPNPGDSRYGWSMMI